MSKKMQRMQQKGMNRQNGSCAGMQKQQ